MVPQAYLVCTLLGILFFLRSLNSQFSACRHGNRHHTLHGCTVARWPDGVRFPFQVRWITYAHALTSTLRVWALVASPGVDYALCCWQRPTHGTVQHTLYYKL